MKYDLVIPAAPKDYNKVKFCVTSAAQWLEPQPENIFVISPAPTHVMSCGGQDVQWLRESEVLDLDPRACTGFNRSEWIYAQFIKMFQKATPHNNYLVVDSDLVFNRLFEVFSPENKPQFFLGIDQNHTPYFRFSQQYLGFGREYPHSFISEIMLFNKEISQEIADINGGVEEFYRLCARVAYQDCIPADYEIYGNYVYKNYPDLYEIVNIKTKLNGQYGPWGDDQIVALITAMKQEDTDVFTYHTWI
jgi:hypothetical protein